ncbi:MAG TPA: hypothetical protein VGH87_13400 [Polyangiaceae bacterium]
MRWLALLFGASVLVPAIARADAESCVAASDEGQKLRDEGHLRAARAKLATCAAEECPSPVRGNCVQWLDDVDKKTPSIVVAATSNGKDASDVIVSIDGAVVTQHLDGGAIPLDPGEHKLHYEHAGDPPQDDTIVLREGERDRALHVSFGSTFVPPPPPPKKPPTLAYAMTGVAIGGALGFGGFGLAGLLVIDNCNSNKASCDVEAHKTATLASFIVADVSLGVAVVTASIAIWAFVKHAKKPAPVSGVRFDPLAGTIVF